MSFPYLGLERIGNSYPEFGDPNSLTSSSFELGAGRCGARTAKRAEQLYRYFHCSCLTFTSIEYTRDGNREFSARTKEARSTRGVAEPCIWGFIVASHCCGQLFVMLRSPPVQLWALRGHPAEYSTLKPEQFYSCLSLFLAIHGAQCRSALRNHPTPENSGMAHTWLMILSVSVVPPLKVLRSVPLICTGHRILCNGTGVLFMQDCLLYTSDAADE